MNCETVRTWMSEYIDGMLDPGHAASFRAHLDECPACRLDLAAMEKTVTLVRCMQPVAPPANLIQSVHARLEAGGKPRASLRPMKLFPPLLAIAAGLVLVVGVGAYFFREHGRRQESFMVASVAHKQVSGDAAVKRNLADLSFKPQKAEADRFERVRESRAAVADNKQEAKAKIAADKDAVQQLRQEDNAMALLPKKAFGDARAGAADAQPAAPASLPAETEQAGAMMDKAATATVASRSDRAFAGAADSAGKGAASPSAAVPPEVKLTVATTNRAAVEQVLLAFDVKRRGAKEPQEKQLKAPAHQSHQAIDITLPASQLQDLLAQLRLQGTLSVAEHSDLSAEAIRAKAEAPGAQRLGTKEGDLLAVHVIITAP